MISKISFLPAFVLILSSGMAQNTTEEFSEFEKHTFHDGEDSLLYRLLPPDPLTENRSYPLVVFLHGSGERGNDNTSPLKHIAPLFLNPENRSKYPAFVLVPQCPEELTWTYPGWYQEPKQPMKGLIKLIDQFAAKNEIDTMRIYLTGVSMGGYATWYLLTRFPKKFAAAIPICGGGDASRVAPFVHVPIWAFHGRRDESVPVEQSRQMIQALKRVGGKPKYTEYKGVRHNSWERAYKEEELLKWLFLQAL